MCNYVKCLRNDFVSILPKSYINKLSYLIKNRSTGHVLIWPSILAVTSGLLYRYNRNLIYMEDSKKLIVYDRCTNYLSCKISIFPEVWKLWKSGNMQIWKLWKYSTLKLCMFLGWNVWIMYLCMHVCRHASLLPNMAVTLYMCITLHVHMYVLVLAHISMSLHVCKCVCMQVDMYECECIHLCMYVCRHAYIYM